MNIMFAVNQAEALARGINAPSSTVTLDIDPTTLPAEHRALLSLLLTDGHRCNEVGVRIDDDWNPVVVPAPKRIKTRYHIEGVDFYLRLIDPTLGGLQDALQDLERRLTDREVAFVANYRQAEQRANKIIDEAVAEADSTEVVPVDYIRDEWEFGVHLRREMPRMDVRSITPWKADAAHRDQLETLRKLQERRWKAAYEAGWPEAEQAYAQRQQTKAAQAAERSNLLAQLPATTRERIAAGFASDDEVDDLLRDIMVSQAGYTATVDPDLRVLATGWLSDDEFLAFKRLKDNAPEGARVRAVERYDDDEDEGTTTRFAEITWKHGGVEATVLVPLSDETAYDLSA